MPSLLGSLSEAARKALDAPFTQTERVAIANLDRLGLLRTDHEDSGFCSVKRYEAEGCSTCSARLKRLVRIARGEWCDICEVEKEPRRVHLRCASRIAREDVERRKACGSHVEGCEALESPSRASKWHSADTIRASVFVDAFGVLQIGDWLALVPGELRERAKTVALRAFVRVEEMKATPERLDAFSRELASELANLFDWRSYLTEKERDPGFGGPECFGGSDYE